TRSKRDWSSDVCSSDLGGALNDRNTLEEATPGKDPTLHCSWMVSLGVRNRFADGGNLLHRAVRLIDCDIGIGMAIRIRIGHGNEIGRASCRERVRIWVW